MLRAVVYARISKDSTGQALGVERQVEDCLRRVTSESDWTLAREPYIDNDISAYRAKYRPEYTELMDAVEWGEVDIIVCWRMDRLWRNSQERVAAIDLLAAKRVRVVMINGPGFDLSSASGVSVAKMIGEVDTMESAVKSERARREAQQRAEMGRPNGGTRRFGFTAKGMEVIPEEADIIRECARRVIDGESLSSVMHWLNNKGVKPPKAAKWERTSLRNVLRAPHIAGRRYYKGVDVGPANHGPILDEATWIAVKLKLETNKAAPNSNRGKYLLAGIALCGLCDSRLWSSSRTQRGIQYRYYACLPKVEGGCRKVHRSLPKLDEHVTRVITGYLSREDVRAQLISGSAPRIEETMEVERDLKAVEEQLVNIAVELADKTDDIGRRQFRAADARLREKLTTLQQRKARLAERSVFGGLVGVEDIEAYWEDLPLRKQRELIKALAVIKVHPANKRPGFDPSLIEIKWNVVPPRKPTVI